MNVIGYLRDVKTQEDVFELVEGENSVGRDDGNEIKISSRSVSKKHAVIEIDVSQRQLYMAVKDHGSRNATWVNEVLHCVVFLPSSSLNDYFALTKTRVLGTSRELRWGDVIRFHFAHPPH